MFAMAAGLLLAAIACTPQANSSSDLASRSGGRSPAASDSGANVRGGGPWTFDASGLRSTAPVVSGGAVYWASDDISANPAGRGRLFRASLASGKTEMLHTATDGTGVLASVRASERWIAWFEYADRSTAKDSRLFVMSTSGGDPVLIDDARADGTLAALSDLALDGDDLYWTVPRVVDGVWRGELHHRRLPDAATDVERAGEGFIFGWPAAREGALAYEVASQKDTRDVHVEYRTSRGVRAKIAAPASEPAIGHGFIAFKASARYDAGELRAYLLPEDQTVTIGAGEAPSAGGELVLYNNNQPSDAGIHVARPRTPCKAVVDQTRQSHADQPMLSDEFGAWVVRDANRPRGSNESIFVTTLQGSPC